ncbi:MAG: DUF2399 domain-containing protein [Syntrophomonadaceae bacterium]|jgi:hypothetical protein|nr:DUF2399 domain-containing protein [Syntrophomonadaceae bacterium]
MDNTILSFLQARKKKTILLTELERLVGGQINYGDFALLINDLEQKGILIAVKQQGYNQKTIPLANSYRIVQSKIPADYLQEIERFHFLLNPLIKLEAYYSLSASEWENDLPYILLLNDFLKEQGIPNDEATAPERSYVLVGDEKWIDEKGGKKLLERVGLWSAMNITYLPEPLMLAVNQLPQGEETSLHLVVENKTAFHALLKYLPDTNFCSLIYGAGWKITADIFMLDKQLGLKSHKPCIYYFGDLDYEGISIWHTLNMRYPALLALPFYSALLSQPAARGKENQVCNEEALAHFLTYFPAPDQERIRDILSNGGYYPQEALSRTELGSIWRNASWN